MDCKNLMIGDWVKVDQTTETVKAKVLGVHKDGVINYEVDYSGVRATDITHADYVSPIELTKDILVKNGFERCDYNNKYFIIDDAIDLITPKWRGGTEYYACAWYQDEFDDIVQHIEICKCAYVHQLQHLLRLCGIEKEIEL